MNEIANNGVLSFANAAWTHHLDYSVFYRTLPKDEACQRVRQLLREPGVEYPAPGNNIRRHAGEMPTAPI